MSTNASLTRQLYAILARPVTFQDRQRAALHLLDWTGCAVIGSKSEAGRILSSESGLFGHGACKAIGLAGGVSAAHAAFANGGLGNILEMDDIHRTSILHPGPVVIPAVLAAAQAFGLSGNQMLDGLVRGYEALIRIGRSVGPAHYAKWHSTGSCGPFGAAAGAALSLGLGEDEVVSALGNAGSTASGLWRCRHEPVMTKQWHTARAAEDGLAAAFLARTGLTGPDHILEGEQGFYEATAPGADPDAVLADPDANWLIYDTSFKPWPACRHAHPAIDAAILARPDIEDTDSIKSVEVETYSDAIRFCDRPLPVTEIEAKFSLQHAVAVTLYSGAPQMSHFRPENLGNEPVASLRSKVTVRIGDEFDRAYPHHYGSAVAVTRSDGSVRRFGVPDALGDPENPLGSDAVAGKARVLMAEAGMQEVEADALVEQCLSLPDRDSVDPYAECLP